MYTIEYFHECFIFLLLLFLVEINMIESDHQQDDNHRFENLYRDENTSVRLTCDLTDVAWWKRPNLLATRYGTILPKYHTKMNLEKIHDGTTTSGIQLNVLNIHQVQSTDAGTYECETLGAIRQFNLTVTVRLTTVELGAQVLSSSSHNSIKSQRTNQTDKNLSHQSSSSPHFPSNKLSSNNEHLHVREHQLIRLTCVVPRAYPAASIHFPFDLDYRVEKNSTIANADRTFRTVVVLVLHVNRFFHKRSLHCQATQPQYNYDESKQQHQHHRILSNSLEMDVAYGPTCSHKIPLPPQFFTGLHRPINLTCFMHDSNPPKLNFTWLLPNGNKRLGSFLNTTSTYITLTPNHIDEFGQAICRAQNELGLVGECHINLIMGGIPDPIESCQYTYLNSTLQVNCLAGFHQGDEDFFCYMYKKQDNGIYSEHARLKGNCAFILPELHPERYHEFRVFTKNKFGDNYDRSFSISVGKPKVESLVDKTRNYWPLMAICIIGACLLSFLLLCCCCHQIRRAIYRRKTKGNFDSLTYQNHSPHSHVNANGKQSQVHLKQNGNGTAYPVRPYRSKDYLITSETTNTPRNNPAYRTVYSTDEDFKTPPRNPLKETDLDQLLGSTSNANSSATATIKTLPLNRPRPLFAAFGPQIPLDDLNQAPLTLQRRSSFQAATKLNGLDFYTSQEPFYLIDRQLMKNNQRSNYSPERDLREREHYREKRREYSPELRNDNLIDINRQTLLDSTSRSRDNSIIVENHMLTTSERLTPTSSGNEQNWREMNAIEEMDYNDRYIETDERDREDFREQHDDQNQFLANDDDRDRISIGYQRDDDTTFTNYDRDDDRYRDDGIFV